MIDGWRCPNCGAGVAPSERVCPRCSSAMRETLKAQAPAGITAAPCVTCGRQVGLPGVPGACQGGHVQVVGMGG